MNRDAQHWARKLNKLLMRAIRDGCIIGAHITDEPHEKLDIGFKKENMEAYVRISDNPELGGER